MNYMGRGFPESICPQRGQPVQCTRRCFDYNGFAHAACKELMNVIDVSENGISMFVKDGLLLQDGTKVPADIVIFATGYDIFRSITCGPKYDVHGQEMNFRDAASFSQVPNLFYNLAGCPLFCVVPRVTEDSMPFFLRGYRQLASAGFSGSVFFYAFPMPSFKKKNSILFAPGCHSRRYRFQNGDVNENAESSTYQAGPEIQSVPIPRFAARILFWIIQPKFVASTSASSSKILL